MKVMHRLTPLAFQAPTFVSLGSSPKHWLTIFALLLTTSRAMAQEPIVGFTEPITQIELAASETGTLSQLSIKRGDVVKAGQVLGSLDIEVLEANRRIAQARLDSTSKLKAAGIRLSKVQQDLEKLQQLRSEGMGSKRELALAVSEYELARTDVEAVNEEMQLSKLTIKRFDAEIRRRSLISPIAGIVTEIKREIGEFVAATDPQVITVVNLSQLRIRFYPQTEFAEPLNIGDKLNVQFVHSNAIQAATVEFIAPVINANSNTIQVDVLLDNSAGKLRSGRRCVLLQNRSSIPRSAAQIGQKPDSVFHGRSRQ